MRQRLAAIPLLILWACQHPKPPAMNIIVIPKDIHSFSNPQQISVKHLNLDLSVFFERLSVQGTVVLTLDRHDPKADRLILDTRLLQIDETEWSQDGSAFHEAQFQLGPNDGILGRALTIHIPLEANFVRVTYSSDPQASGLQWLTPEQTAGKQNPFMYSQSQAIHARSWIPLQDTPGVRLTFDAKIHVPQGLTAVMAAQRLSPGSFRMEHPIPSYLIAIAVGELSFQSTGNRTGVYAEPSVTPRAAKEFDDTEHMLEAAEKLFGPYRWGRYDLLVMPPSFPFGGMENPCLTFATPTILAGDKSLVSLVAHELAHSWSGNLVTNATWSDFWLNEGFTTYFERRIVEAVYGREREEMEAALGFEELQDEIKSLPAKDTILHIDLTGRDPDDGATQVPYEKGALFLRSLEEEYGREKFDLFLKGYFDHFAFQSITTAQAIEYMKANLDPAIHFDEWIYKPGLPADAPHPASEAFDKVDAAAKEWTKHGKLPEAAAWSTHEWLRFLHALPDKLTLKQMQALDHAYSFTESGNDEILEAWLLMSVRNHYAAADDKLEEFLTTVGRRKYIKPLYEELAKTPRGKERAIEIYETARPGYHPIAQSTMDGILRKP
jgi:leukotriene A-4 hydrolase/aminopeptidase